MESRDGRSDAGAVRCTAPATGGFVTPHRAHLLIAFSPQSEAFGHVDVPECSLYRHNPLSETAIWAASTVVQVSRYGLGYGPHLSA
jgi:hypothetical protein